MDKITFDLISNVAVGIAFVWLVSKGLRMDLAAISQKLNHAIDKFEDTIKRLSDRDKSLYERINQVSIKEIEDVKLIDNEVAKVKRKLITIEKFLETKHGYHTGRYHELDDK